MARGPTIFMHKISKALPLHNMFTSVEHITKILRTLLFTADHFYFRDCESVLHGIT